MRTRDKLLFSVIERYLYHSRKKLSGNPVVREFAEKMCDIEIWEMWVLTQE